LWDYGDQDARHYLPAAYERQGSLLYRMGTISKTLKLTGPAIF
jgi:hypothetical protein